MRKRLLQRVYSDLLVFWGILRIVILVSLMTFYNILFLSMHRKWLKIICAPKEELQLWNRFIKTKLKLFPRTLAVVDLYLPLIAIESPSLEALTASSSMVHALAVSTDAHALSVKITLSPSTAGGFTDNDQVARRHSSNRCVISCSSHRLPGTGCCSQTNSELLDSQYQGVGKNRTSA